MPTRFWDKVDASGDCWLWMGARHTLGYGQWAGTKRWRQRYLNATTLAHRLVWMTLVGPIEDGLTLDHLCRNPPCVNPDHLEPVTHRENIRRGEAVGRPRTTHCKYGHERRPENTHIKPSGERVCILCRREKGRLQARKHHAGLTEPDKPLLTECKRGHPYDDKNTYIDPRGRRHCKACRALALRRMHRRRSLVSPRPRRVIG